MKKRIKDTPVSSNEFCGEFYDNYHKPIDWFFGERKEETVYIKDVETVNKIESILFNESSNIIYLIGKAGIGKTTLIRNEFGVSDNQVFLDENRKNIFVSLGFRGQLVENDISGFMANSISAICEFLEDKLDIGESFYSEKGHLEFYDFIKQTMPAILGNVKTTELIGKNNIEAKLFRLEKAQEYNLYSYEASRLKYYLLKYCRNYKKLVIMVDNTEGFSDEIQKLIIRNMLSFFSCLLNVAEKDKNEMLSINLIVSMRDTSFVKIKK